MNSRKERELAEQAEWNLWNDMTIPHEMPPDVQALYEKYVKEGVVSHFAEEPGAWVESGFIGACFYGDVIWKGDTIRMRFDGEWEHQSCDKEGGPVWTSRLDFADPEMDSDNVPYEGDGFDPHMEDLPGMWDRSDVSGGEADSEDHS